MGIFYIVSVFLIISIVPWNDPMLVQVGSYQRALELMNIPHAKMIVDIVVLIAVASCLNSAIYTASRMVYSLSKRGDGPRVLQRTSATGVPVIAVLASTAVGFLTTALNYFAPDEVFSFLLASSGAVALLVYLAIAVSQLVLRNRMDSQGTALDFKMWLFPGSATGHLLHHQYLDDDAGDARASHGSGGNWCAGAVHRLRERHFLV